MIVGAGTIGLLVLLAARLRGAGAIIVTDLNAHRLVVGDWKPSESLAGRRLCSVRGLAARH